MSEATGDPWLALDSDFEGGGRLEEVNVALSEDDNPKQDTKASTAALLEQGLHTQEILTQTLKTTKELLDTVRFMSYRETRSVNQDVKTGLACLRFDCFQLLIAAINKPEFKERGPGWRIPLNPYDGATRYLPSLSTPLAKAPDFINYFVGNDLKDLSNGILDGSELKWLQDDRIGFQETRYAYIGYGHQQANFQYEALAGLLLFDLYENQRRKVRSIFKFVNNKEIEDMGADDWLFEK